MLREVRTNHLVQTRIHRRLTIEILRVGLRTDRPEQSDRHPSFQTFPLCNSVRITGVYIITGPSLRRK